MADLLVQWLSLKPLLKIRLGELSTQSKIQQALSDYGNMVTDSTSQLSMADNVQVAELLWKTNGLETLAQLAVLVQFGKTIASSETRMATAGHDQPRAHSGVDLLARLFAVEALVEDCLQFAGALGQELSERGTAVLRECRDIVPLIDALVTDGIADGVGGRLTKVSRLRAGRPVAVV